jgi:hypothetical protein
LKAISIWSHEEDDDNLPTIKAHEMKIIAHTLEASNLESLILGRIATSFAAWSSLWVALSRAPRLNKPDVDSNYWGELESSQRALWTQVVINALASKTCSIFEMPQAEHYSWVDLELWDKHGPALLEFNKYRHKLECIGQESDDRMGKALLSQALGQFRTSPTILFHLLKEHANIAFPKAEKSSSPDIGTSTAIEKEYIRQHKKGRWTDSAAIDEQK